MAIAPQDVIRRYLDEQGGSAQVPAHNLLTTWRLDDFSPGGCERIGSALAAAGVEADPPLPTLQRDSLVTLRVAPPRGAPPRVPPWGLPEDDEQAPGEADEPQARTLEQPPPAPPPSPKAPADAGAPDGAPAPPSGRKGGGGLVRAGFVLAALALLLGPLAAIPAIVIGVLVATRGRRRAGVAIVAMAVALPVVTAAVLLGVLEGRAYRVANDAMEPTLDAGDRLVTTKVSEPARGDIVTFHPPAGARNNTCGVVLRPAGAPCSLPTRERSSSTDVKRVVAAGGERVKVVRGRVFVDGRPQSEPFARVDRACRFCNLPLEVTIPKDHFFLMGDNRGASADSRQWGPVPKAALVGEARFRFYPIGAVGKP
jgi:signal peptidase I